MRNCQAIAPSPAGVEAPEGPEGLVAVPVGGGRARAGLEIDHSEPQARVWRSRGRAATHRYTQRPGPTAGASGARNTRGARIAARPSRARKAARPSRARKAARPSRARKAARPGRGHKPKPQELGGVTTHGSVGRERNPVIPRASAMSEAQRAPGTPRDDPMNETTSSVDQPRPRRSERVTAPSRLANRAPEGASARGTCAYVGSGAPSRWAS